ncbi:hypothetical protein [Mesorhizobium sp. B2-3-5]|uniref:hypothetical protein n=1 Tax=Mesorhizobium sp. B2-3-5 TaxID=2589958 RepID=UPI0015E450F2|nr:hypothetical protein [Mesorhizobium sp. B2-3-5]
MVHIIPLSVGQRRLDTGNAPQYPQGSPVGAAMQGFGDGLSALAEHHRQMTERQEAFDAELARRRFNGQIAQAEEEVTANAPADGAGLHDAMYGQVDPRTGRVVKTGLFDTLFDAVLPNIPKSQRANFAKQKEALREAGSDRMAQRQLQRRDDYELAEWAKVDAMSTSAIAKSDPNETANFEAIRRSGSALIAKIGNPLARQAAEAAWRTNTAKALIQAIIAQDPKRAVEMLGAAQAGSRTKDDTAEVIGGQQASATSSAASKGDRLGKPTPDERVAQAFRDDIPPEDWPALARQAQAADAAQQVEMRTSIGLAEQNAPAAIRDTGIYSGPTPTPEQFVALYGATEGVRRFQGFNRAIDVSRQFYDMRWMSNETIRARVRDSAPRGDSTNPEEDKARHDAIATAADLTFKVRQGDPGGYVRKTFAHLDAAWNNLSKPEDYQAAIIGSIAAQQQLGFETVQPLPSSVAGGLVGKLKDKTWPQQGEDVELRNVFAALPNQAAHKAVLAHLIQTGAPHADSDIANSSFRAAVVDPMGLLDLANTVEPGQSGAKAELTSYIPTGQEWLGGLIAGDSERGSLRRFLAQKLVGSDGLGEDGISVADFTPLGASFALEKAANSALDGNYGQALLNAAGAFPADRLAAAALQRAGKIAKPWAESLSIFSKRPSELVEGGDALVRGVDTETLRFQQAIARSTSPQAPRRRTQRGEISESAVETALLASLLARDPSAIKYAGAKVGWSKSKNYRKTFSDANPTLDISDYVVHHSVEQGVLQKYPGLFTDEEMHSVENLRGIRKEFDAKLHQKVIRSEWNEFYKAHVTATRQQVLDYATQLDKKYGHLFDPPIGE